MKNTYFKRIIFIVIAILFIYSAYWLFISVQFKTQIKNNLDNMNSSYSNISVSGYPYRMSALINDLMFSKFENNFLSNMNFHDVRIDMNPFQIDTLYLRSNQVEGSDITNSSESLFNFKNLQGKIVLSEGIIMKLLLISDYLDLNYNEYKVGTMNQLLMRMDLDDQSVYKINFSGIANDLLNSYIGKTKVSINGEISSITNNGNLQVDIIENENQNKLFSAPLTVNNGKVSFLFMPLLDLKDLSFF
tara:strand:+ start:80 stop:817 length:738 start_codon:yes stop_codon:yes gene_type:complete